MDKAFGMGATQQQVYECAVKPIFDKVLEGQDATVFTYGQAASGKTHTMVGELEDPDHQGILPRISRTLFARIQTASKDIDFTILVSMMEIYMEKVIDLLGGGIDLKVLGDEKQGVQVKDLKKCPVTTDEELLEVIAYGTQKRHQKDTKLNKASSRSQLIMALTIEQRNLKDGTK